ncbi:unnamed protein product [Ceratitis capitata]|uniref:(Mediterranean fruit fly) hypothetical protein n=1 Tax=Ceratitis capitata TaxID=7213 RepID=A0A811V7J9_CERCA|nr:unnamed protein product [Ceratitis capitata]
MFSNDLRKEEMTNGGCLATGQDSSVHPHLLTHISIRSTASSTHETNSSPSAVELWRAESSHGGNKPNAAVVDDVSDIDLALQQQSYQLAESTLTLTTNNKRNLKKGSKALVLMCAKAESCGVGALPFTSELWANRVKKHLAHLRMLIASRTSGVKYSSSNNNNKA